MNLKLLPKIELHRHLELSARHSTLKELAPKAGIYLKDSDDFEKHFLIKEPMKNLGAVLSKFIDTQKIYFSEENIERVTFECCEDAFLDGVRILELRYAPTFITQNHKLSFQQAHDAIVRGVERAEEKYPMAVGLLCTIQRILSVEIAKDILKFVLKNKNTFVGVDLADNEEEFDSKPFASVFLEAKRQGLGVTIHSGEINTPKAHLYVKEAIEHLGATRIGHGVQIYKDAPTMDFVKKSGVTLELCPTSNFICNAVNSIKEHPFREIMSYGIKTTINSDDPGIFNISLLSEYELLQKEKQFTLKEFYDCNENAYKASFINEEKKKAVWDTSIYDKSI